MQKLDPELDRLQGAYKAEVEAWILAIRHEEGLASVDHSIAKIDLWEAAHDQEDRQRNKVLAAKKAYEAALRKQIFDF